MGDKSDQPAHTFQAQPKDPRKEAASEFANYRFSPEEMRVIKECEAEAMFKRCIPFGFGAGMTAYIAVQRGLLKANPKFGAAPKVIACALVGYIAGRFSYQSVCVEKLMNLPGSRFAELLRQSKRIRSNASSWNDTITINTDAGVATALSLAPFQSFNSEQQPDSLNLDTTRPDYSGFDEYTPSKDGTNNLDAELNIPASKSGVSYEELRQKNRAEYARSQTAPINTPPPASPSQDGFDQRPLNSRLRANRDEAQAGSKNQYGDVWSK